VGGPGGAGTFADLALLDGSGDDVLTADRRLPPMLAGAALLERAAAASPELRAFGWRGDRPRELRAMVAWSVTTHLGATATEDEIDALTTYVATLAPPAVRPPLRASLALRVAHGAERLRADGCTSCHAESLPVSDPTLRLSHGRSLDLSALLSLDGLPPYRVEAWTDLRLHRVDRTPSAPPVVTPPLWGVASRGPFLHDGRASTLREAIADHDGEARASRDAWTKDDAKKDLELFLLTLSRAPRMEWMH
jgi:CxxC motif-containing protein (DUF1111 family)